MNSRLNQRIQDILKAKHRRKVWARIVAILGIFVVLFTSLQLSSPADAVTEDQSPVIAEYYSEGENSDSLLSENGQEEFTDTAEIAAPAESIASEEYQAAEGTGDSPDTAPTEEGAVTQDYTFAEGAAIAQEIPAAEGDSQIQDGVLADVDAGAQDGAIVDGTVDAQEPASAPAGEFAAGADGTGEDESGIITGTEEVISAGTPGEGTPEEGSLEEGSHEEGTLDQGTLEEGTLAEDMSGEETLLNEDILPAPAEFSLLNNLTGADVRQSVPLNTEEPEGILSYSEWSLLIPYTQALNDSDINNEEMNEEEAAADQAAAAAQGDCVLYEVRQDARLRFMLHFSIFPSDLLPQDALPVDVLTSDPEPVDTLLSDQVSIDPEHVDDLSTDSVSSEPSVEEGVNETPTGPCRIVYQLPVELAGAVTGYAEVYEDGLYASLYGYGNGEISVTFEDYRDGYSSALRRVIGYVEADPEGRIPDGKLCFTINDSVIASAMEQGLYINGVVELDLTAGDIVMPGEERSISFREENPEQAVAPLKMTLRCKAEDEADPQNNEEEEITEIKYSYALQGGKSALLSEILVTSGAVDAEPAEEFLKTRVREVNCDASDFVTILSGAEDDRIVYENDRLIVDTLPFTGEAELSVLLDDEKALRIVITISGKDRIELGLAEIMPADGSYLPEDMTGSAYLAGGADADEVVLMLQEFLENASVGNDEGSDEALENVSWGGEEALDNASVESVGAAEAEGTAEPTHEQLPELPLRRSLKSANGLAMAKAVMEYSPIVKPQYRVFDISLDMDSQQQAEYEDGFDVSVRLPEALTGRNFHLYHLHDGGIQEISGLVLDETEPAESGEKTVTGFSFNTDGFSLFVLSYTVDFSYEMNGKTFEFSIPGGGYVSLTGLMELLEIVAADDAKEFVSNVLNVEFSDPELVDVSRADADITVGQIKDDRGLDIQYSAELTQEEIDEINTGIIKAGDWALISIQPFTSEEILTITMKDGEIFTVTVTDAAEPNPDDPLGLDGQSLAIINNRDGGTNWVSLNGNVDGTKDSRGYYMSASGSSYSSEGGVDYSSSSDVFWTFEYVRSDSSGSYYRISSPNGYLYIDPNVNAKSDMPSNNNHQYVRALRLESQQGNGSASDGTLIRVVPNGDGTYLLQNRNGVSLWNYGGNTFWLSTVDKDGESATSILNSRIRLARRPIPPHVTVHYVDRYGNVLTGVSYTGSNAAVTDNGDGTFTIPFSVSGDVDLRAQFDFSSVGPEQQVYTYANTHLAGQNASGETLTYEGYVIDSRLTGTGSDITMYSDSGETSVPWNNPMGIVMGNRAYNSLTAFSLSGQINRRPVPDGSVIKYAESGNKDIYVILDPLPTQSSVGSGNVNPGDVEDPSLEKTMEDNGDGTYTLSLKVDAHASDAADTNKANVLLVVDTSSSMRAYTSNDNSRSRITDTHDAVLELGDKLLAYNNSNPGAVEVAMLTFDGSVVERLDWTTNKDTFDSVVNEYLRYYYLHKGTDWEDSLKEALNKLQNDTDDDPTFVIFFTDGEPSQYTNFSGMGENNNQESPDPITHSTDHESVSNGYPDFYSYFLSRESSKDEMRAIVDAGARLYGVYAYNSTQDSYSGYNGNEDGALMLHNAIRYGYNTAESLENKLYFEAHNTDDLRGAFDAIFNSITEAVGFSNVVVNDGIAAGVTSSTVVDGDVSGFTYTIKDKSGALAYQVKVAPNGVTQGETVADGLPVFTLADGSVHVGEKRQVPVSKVVTVGNGNPIPDGSGKIQTQTVNVEVYYYDDGNGHTYIMPIATTGENVVWDLSPLGILKDGYSYDVSFVVWPNQEAYDLVADLNNGKRPDIEATADWGSRPLLTDGAGRQYRKGGFPDYPYITRYEDTGVYAALSNTEQSVNYYKIDQKIENGEEVTEITGPYPTSVDPPDPMPLTSSMSRIEKQWNVERDVGILAQYLYNTDGTSKEFHIDFDVYQGNSTTPYVTTSLGWDSEKGQYVWAADSPLQTVTYAGHTHQIGTRWAEEFSIATGLMLSTAQMEARGLNKNDFPSGTYGGTTYYILEPGHDYTIKEHQTGTIGYEFDFSAPVYHPMLVDGTLQSVTFTLDGKNATITEMTEAEQGLASLLIENTLRGYIHVDKVVVDKDNQEIVTDETKFEYTVILQNSTDPGPFEGDHIPWYGISGLFYHDSSDNYYQIYETEERTWVLTDENGDTFEVTSTGFNPDLAENQTVTYIKDGEPVTVVVAGNQMIASSDGKTAQAVLKITRSETLNIANIPVGTVYAITESAINGYQLVGIAKEIKNGDDVESSQTVTDLSGRGISGTIVENRDNHIVFTNRLLPGALKFTKVVQVDGAAPSTEEYQYVDGNYIFTVTTPEGVSPEMLKYIQITVTNGQASSYKIADTEEALADTAAVSGAWAVLNNLPEGDYIITETEERNGLLLTDIVRTDGNTLAADIDAGTVLVHVTTEDLTAAQPDASATFTNNYYNNDGPDRIALDIVKEFRGLGSAADLPQNFRIVISYLVGSNPEPVEIALRKGQDETVTAGGEHIKIKETTDGFVLSWHITNVPSNASGFMIKETGYDTGTGYTFVSADLNGADVTQTAGEWHEMTVTAPTATLTEVTNQRRTSDSNADLEFILEDNDVLLSKLTANQGTLVISKKSLNSVAREAVKSGWPSQGGFKLPPIFFSIEEHPTGFQYGGKEVTFSTRADGKTIVAFTHNASAQEAVFIVNYSSESEPNNSKYINTYEPVPVTLELIKVDVSDMETPLENAAFLLKKLDPDDTGHYLTGDGALEILSDDTGDDGKTSFEGLTDGYYEISEKKTPAGYVLTDDGKFYIKVSGGAVSLIEKTADDPATEDVNEGLVKNWPEKDGSSGRIRFVNTTPAVPDNPETTDIDESAEAIAAYKVGNTPGVALPNTGGSGTVLYTVPGGILALLAAALFAITRYLERCKGKYQ